jgi:hypothetical protein
MLHRATEVKNGEGRTLLQENVIRRIKELAEPESLAIFGTVLAGWGVAHYFGVGEVADVVAALIGYSLFGTDAVLIGKDVYLGVKIALEAQTDEDLNEAAKHMAHGLSVAVRDLALWGAGKAAGKGLKATKELVKQIREKGLTPVVRGGVVHLVRKVRTFLRNTTGTAWFDADSRALNRIMDSQDIEFTYAIAQKLEQAAESGRMKTPKEALDTFKEILTKEGLDWSKLSEAAQKEIAGIAERFAIDAPSNVLPAVNKAVNSDIQHAADQAVKKGVLADKAKGLEELRKLSSKITKDGFPAGTIRDPGNVLPRLDSVLVPFGNGAAVYEVTKKGTAVLRTVLSEAEFLAAKAKLGL